MADFYFNINNSYSATGDGTIINPYSWDIGANSFINFFQNYTSSANFYLSGTRVLNSNLNLVNELLNSDSIILLKGWNENPFFINANGYSIYISVLGGSSDIEKNLTLKVQNGIFEGNSISIGGGNNTSEDATNNVYIINSHIKTNTFYSYIKKNYYIINSNLDVYDYWINYSLKLYVINSIIDSSNITLPYYGSQSITNLDNCVFTSALSSFSWGSWVTSSNCQDVLGTPSSFNKSTSALNLSSDFGYLTSGLSAISINGNTLYTDYGWYGTRRDGVGALYFNTVSGTSGYSISANSTSALVAPNPQTILVKLNSDNVFNTNKASSATYTFGNGITSSVNSNSIVSAVYSSASYYYPYATISSKNGWYTYTTSSSSVLVKTKIEMQVAFFDKNGSNITSNPEVNILDNFTVSANVDYALTKGTVEYYRFDFGNGYIINSTSPSVTYSYTSAGTYPITISAVNSTLQYQSVSSSNLLIEYQGITATVFYVNVTSAYDSSSTHVGTSSDPFTFSEFVDCVKPNGCGNFKNTFKLRGNRNLVNLDGVVPYIALNCDKNKNFTIDAWNLSAYGPWIFSVEDYSLTDNNAIFSAVGTTLKNGIIYNKPYGFPSRGGTIVLTKTYNMFIVNQGIYSNIAINPFNNEDLSTSSITTSSVSGISSDKPSWLTLGSYIYEDYCNSAGCCSANRIDSYWSQISAFNFSANSSYAYSGCVMYGTSILYLNTSANMISGGFILEFPMVIGTTGSSNKSVHLRMFTSAGGEILNTGLNNNNIFVETNDVGSSTVVETFSAVPGDYIWMKYQRNLGSPIISAFYKYVYSRDITSGKTTGTYYTITAFSANPSSAYSGPVYMSFDGGSTFWGFGELYFQATSGFPYTWTSGVSSTTISGMSATQIISPSAYSNVYGSTIYCENGIEDQFDLETALSSVSNYNINLVDSVFVNFRNATNSADNFTSATFNIYNSCFTNSLDSITSGFTISNYPNNQYNFSGSPTNFPFTINCSLYGKDIDYVIENRKLLRPFRGILTPPNPGKNYNTYAGYETGLFGYSRKDYVTSANI